MSKQAGAEQVGGADVRKRVLVGVRFAGEAALSRRVPQAWARSVTLAVGTLDDLCERHGAERVESDLDGELFLLPSVSEAVAFAAQAQLQLMGVDWPPALLLREEAAEVLDEEGRVLFRGPRVSMAIHEGLARVERHPGRRAVAQGPGVHLVARVSAVTHGGQVLLTEGARRALVGHPVKALVLRDLGPHSLLGVPGEIQLSQCLPDVLDKRSFSALATARHRGTDLWGDQRDLHGRLEDLEALRRLFEMGTRLVTVTGPAGVGKSHLARAFAIEQVHHYARRGGVWWCDFTGISTMEPLLQRIAETLDLSVAHGRSSEETLTQIGLALAARGETLLVLDGFDGLAPWAAHTVGRALRAAPSSRGIVTCRHRLGLRGEVCYALGPLPVIGADGAKGPAQRLFEASARAASPSWQPEPGVEGACLGLGGHPGAIVWAASSGLPVSRWLAAPSEPELVLDVCLLALTDAERAALLRLACLPGGFDRLVGRAVVEEADSDERVQSLLRRGLLQRVEVHRAPGVVRAMVPSAVRAALLPQVSREDRLAISRPVAAQVLDAVAPWEEDAWRAQGAEVFAWLATEAPALFAVIRGTAEPDADSASVDLGLRAVLALRPLLMARGPIDLLLWCTQTALGAADRGMGADPLLQLRVLIVRAEVLLGRGQLDRAAADLSRAEVLAERWADEEGRALVLWMRGGIGLARGESNQAEQDLTAAIGLFEAHGRPRMAALSRGLLGTLHQGEGRMNEAALRFGEAIVQLRDAGYQRLQAYQLGHLGVVTRRLGRVATTRALYEEAILIHRRSGEVRQEGLVRCNLAQLELQLGQLNLASEGCAQALALACEAGDRQEEARCLVTLGVVELQLGEPESARRRLLRAFALVRSGADPAIEGFVTGYLAISHHFAEQPELAREHYQRAIRIVEGARERWHEVLFRAWLAALELEQGKLDRARTLIQVATLQVDLAGDMQLSASISFMRDAIELHADIAMGVDLAVVGPRVDALLAAMARGERQVDGAIQLARSRMTRLLVAAREGRALEHPAGEPVH